MNGGSGLFGSSSADCVSSLGIFCVHMFIGTWSIALASTTCPDASTVTNRVPFGCEGCPLSNAASNAAWETACWPRSSFWRSAMMSYNVRSPVFFGGWSRGGFARGIAGSGAVEAVAAARRCFRFRGPSMFGGSGCGMRGMGMWMSWRIAKSCGPGSRR